MAQHNQKAIEISALQREADAVIRDGSRSDDWKADKIKQINAQIAARGGEVVKYGSEPAKRVTSSSKKASTRRRRGSK